MKLYDSRIGFLFCGIPTVCTARIFYRKVSNFTWIRRSPLKKGSGCKNPLENGKAEVQTPCHPWFHLWSYQRILRIKNCRTPWDDWLFRHFIYSVRQSWQAAPIKISAVFLVFSMVSAFWGKVFGACCFILLVAAVQPKKILWDLWNFVRSARFCQRSPLWRLSCFVRFRS